MKRRTFLHGLTAASTMVLAGAGAFAASYADGVVDQLTRQGFFDIAVETTWLGRVRIFASRGDGQREIILNPRTGEILRDTWLAGDNRTVTPIINDIDHDTSGGDEDSGGDNSGSGGGDDNSGSGGGDDNSESGGGDDNSGSGGGDNNSGSSGGDDNSGSGGSGGKVDDRDRDRETDNDRSSKQD